MRPIVAAAAGLLLFAAPGSASAGTVTPTQYAYGGGSNATAVISSRPPATGNGAGNQAGRPAPGAARAGAGAPGSQRQKHTAKRPQALVGIAAAPATPVGSFGAFNRSIPVEALWAIALALACALGAWLLRRGRSAG